MLFRGQSIKSSRPHGVVVLGAPGAGKGTQAHLLGERMGWGHVSTGDLLRAEVDTESPLGRRSKFAMNTGELVPDELVLKLISKRLQQKDCARGFVLDGFPRSESQAKLLDALFNESEKKLDFVLALEVPREVLMKRLGGRRICSVSGRTLNIHFSSPDELAASKAGGGKLLCRNDDTEEAIAKRLDVYEHRTRPLLARYAKAQYASLLRRIDGTGTPNEVFGRILNVMVMV